MNKLLKFSFIFYLFLFSIQLFSGFSAGTLVKIPGGYRSIDQLQPGNIVYSKTKSGNYCLSKVQKTTSYFLPRAILISVSDDVIIAAPQQKFYDQKKNSWVKAKHLQSLISLLSGYKNMVAIDDVEVLNQEFEFFDIRLEDEHTFLVGKHDIVAHNFPPFFIGCSLAFGGGVSFEGLYLGMCLAGWWLGTKLLKHGDSKKYNPKFSVGGSPAYAGGPDPDDEEWKKKHPYGRYEESPKHHQNSQDGIGKPPRDGQAALDGSVGAKNSSQRVAIQDNKFVVLKRTSDGVYHGYVIENFDSLTQKLKEAFYYGGLIDSMKSGRIKK